MRLSHRIGRAMLVALVGLSGSVSTHTGIVRAEPPAERSAPEWVIPGGQEARVTAMLGGDGALAGCEDESAYISGDRIEVQFRCAGRTTPVRVRMARRSGFFCDGLCTEKFTLRLDPSAPEGLAEALRASVERHEADFVFRRPDERRARAARRAFLIDHGPTIGIGSLLVLVIVRAVLRRRRGDASSSETPPPAA